MNPADESRRHFLRTGGLTLTGAWLASNWPGIVAAADAFSAMTADRIYSKARTPAGAAIELRRSAGAHLDPAVVDALLAVLGLDTAEDARAA